MEEFKLLPLQVVEWRHIYKTLKFHNWNRTHSAIDLEISLRTIRNKIVQMRDAGLEIGECREIPTEHTGLNNLEAFGKIWKEEIIK